MIVGPVCGEDKVDMFSPSNPDDYLGTVKMAKEVDVATALDCAKSWDTTPASERANILRNAAMLYELHSGEIFAALAREAGKTPVDAVAEIREAIDFLRYYAVKGSELESDKVARGLIACISPWNFPLAIFTGQIAAALAAGNGVLAKSSEFTPVIASISVRLMQQAGVPKDVLQLVYGVGATVGAALTSDPRINGVCFTGSTRTAQRINQTIADNLEHDALFIAETGGLNAMIVDSTALPEQAIKDIIVSAFQSAGQRCSALRMLYLQEDVADEFMSMLFGSMDELILADPWFFSTDIGPAINKNSQLKIDKYIEKARQNGTLLKQLEKPAKGYFAAPAIIKVNGISDLQEEVFGPVLHVATFRVEELDQIIDAINECGYGLTFGLHTRIDERVESLFTRLKIGNIYVNRNQIGAIVGSQPFGGMGLSGTGPKAGGPHYVRRFVRTSMPELPCPKSPQAKIEAVQAALDNVQIEKFAKPFSAIDLPGPTGETNRLSYFPRGCVLCLGPTREAAQEQARIAEKYGCHSIMVAADVTPAINAIPGFLDRNALRTLMGFDVVLLWSNAKDLRTARQALAGRNGPVLPLVTSNDLESTLITERHVCINTTASGGNAFLLAGG